MSNEPEKNFEASITRLEEILEKMNSGSYGLEEALKLYEEADQLISTCGKRLEEAERKIEILIKNRNGEVSQDPSGKPLTKPFST